MKYIFILYLFIDINIDILPRKRDVHSFLDVAGTCEGWIAVQLLMGVGAPKTTKTVIIFMAKFSSYYTFIIKIYALRARSIIKPNA